MSSVKLVITDLDDTIYNWSAFYIPSFLAMVDELVKLTGIDAERLKASFKRVHETHRTTEYAFAIQELDELVVEDSGLSSEERLKKYDSAIRAFRHERRRTLRLFPGVLETLERIRQAGIPVVGVSDSMMDYVSRRLRQLDVDLHFAALCAPEDHGLPPGLAAQVARRAPSRDVLGRMAELPLPTHMRKPDSRIVLAILQHYGVKETEAVVVGDSLSRDVLMAQRVGAIDVWAEYGQRRERHLYEELLKITYWSDLDVAEEAELQARARAATPTFSLQSFPQILPVIGLD